MIVETLAMTQAVLWGSEAGNVADEWTTQFLQSSKCNQYRIYTHGFVLVPNGSAVYHDTSLIAQKQVIVGKCEYSKLITLLLMFCCVVLQNCLTHRATQLIWQQAWGLSAERVLILMLFSIEKKPLEVAEQIGLVCDTAVSSTDQHIQVH